jgi:hypothetical protein
VHLKHLGYRVIQADIGTLISWVKRQRSAVFGLTASELRSPVERDVSLCLEGN